MKGWLSSAYGKRIDPITGQPAWHAGIDFAGRQGSDVIAVASGVVVFADRRDGYGNMVEIHHGNGITSRYGHHDKLLVKAGQIVKKGDVIGLWATVVDPRAHMFTLRCSVTVETLILAVLSAMLQAVAKPEHLSPALTYKPVPVGGLPLQCAAYSLRLNKGSADNKNHGELFYPDFWLKKFTRTASNAENC